MPLRLCGAPHNRNYGEHLIMRSDRRRSDTVPALILIFSTHNSDIYFFSFNMAINLSGALKWPPRSDNGLPAVSASSFSLGSERK
jgi:hypothetical protein